MDAPPPPEPPAHVPGHPHLHSSDTNSPPPCSGSPHTQVKSRFPGDSAALDVPSNSCEIPAREQSSHPPSKQDQLASRHMQYPETAAPCSRPVCHPPPPFPLPPPPPNLPS